MTYKVYLDAIKLTLMYCHLFLGLAGTYGQLRELHVKHQSDITLADLVTLAAVEAANEGMRRGG